MFETSPLFTPADVASRAPLPASVHPPFALFDDNQSPAGGAWLLSELRETLVCTDPDDWATTLTRLEKAAQAGAWVALAANYELGYALEPRLRPMLQADNSTALLIGWIFARGDWLDASQCDTWLASRSHDKLGPSGIGGLQAGVEEADYLAHVERVRRYIEAGDCYQVNLTFPLHGHLYGQPAQLYRALRAAQPVQYGAFIVHDAGAILSRSPELFLERHGTTLACRPMKGTAPRSEEPAVLANSEKDRAENVMIVDLIRNDLGRLAPAGGVRVEDLFRIEAYPTVWQMTSRVIAEPVNAGLAEIFQAMFPCGSITGAPKIRAMEIIHELEQETRGLYCGALGWIQPGGDFRFSVPIRTLRIDHAGQARLDVGSGIVYDSRPQAEWAECHLKARFLTALPSELRLIETLLYEPSRVFPYWPEHLERLSDSARYFGFAFDASAVQTLLNEVCASEALRVRMTLGQSGDLTLEQAPLTLGAPGENPTVVLSPHVTHSRDVLLRHKTTARQLYDSALRSVISAGHFDALFLNERGEVTEGARTNVFVEKNGKLLTPPLSSGLLNGVLRRRLLREGRAREAILHLHDLHDAAAIYCGNGLRGLVRVRLAQP